MLNPAHALEVALLLLAAFLAGAVAGTLLRLVALRLRRPVATAAVIADPADPFPVAALVTAPVIDPLPQPAKPAEQPTPAPEQVPVPDFAAAMLALATEVPPEIVSTASREMAPLPEIRRMPDLAPLPATDLPKAEIRPARTAGEATSGRHVGEPRSAPGLAVAPAPAPDATAEVIPFPVAEGPSAAPVVVPLESITLAGEAVLVVADTAMPEAPLVAETVSEATELTPVAELVSEAAELTTVAVEPAGGPHPSVSDDSFVELPAAGLPLDAPIAATRAAEIATADLASTAIPDAALPVRPVDIEPGPIAIVPEPEPEPEAPAEVVLASTEVAPVVEAVPAAKTPTAFAEPPPSDPAPVAAAVAQTDPLPVPTPAGPVVQPAPVAPAAAPNAEDDEAAAMRAIEGNWTPRRTAARPSRPADPPEIIAESVVASGAAVAAAARVIEAVVAGSMAEATVEAPPAPQPVPEPQPAPESVVEPVAAEPEPGRPLGLEAPRHGVKDDLTHIIGVLPVIETALNGLGLFHYDQVAELADDNVDWVETHLGINGRIRRELWREQAHELDLAVRPKAAAGT